MTKNNIITVFILVGILHLATSCSDYNDAKIGDSCDQEGTWCSYPYNTICLNGECVFNYPYTSNDTQSPDCPCTYDSQCGSGDNSLCINGQCYKALLGMGSSCVYNQQCRSANCTSGFCSGAALNQSCYMIGCQDPDTSCLVGVCSYPYPNGTQCDNYYAQPGCEEGLVCGTNGPYPTPDTCQPPKPVGAVCDYTKECQTGLTCRNSSSEFYANYSTWFCNYPFADGEACTYDADCDSSSGCNLGICTAFNSLPEESQCVSSNFCYNGSVCAFLLNGTVSGTCLQINTTLLADGEYCDPDFPFLCENDFCGCRQSDLSLDHHCSLATCGVPQALGEYCDWDATCMPGLMCGANATCIPVFGGKDGDVCRSNDECDLCLFCNDNGKCSKHSGSKCFSADSFGYDDDEPRFCENGQYCDCGKKCKNNDEFYYYAKVSSKACSDSFQWIEANWDQYCADYIGPMVDWYMRRNTVNLSEIPLECQRLVADFECCQYYFRADTNYEFPDSFQNSRTYFGYIWGNQPVQFDCMNLEIVFIPDDPLCCAVSDMSDCPYWSDPLYLNIDNVFFNPLFNIHSENLTRQCEVQNEYKSWNCNEEDYTKLIIGLVVGLGGAAILAGIGALLYLRWKRKGDHTPLK